MAADRHGRAWASPAVAALVALLPQPLKRLVLRRLYGWQIDPTARIGLSLFQGVRDVSLGRGSSIGHFNVFRQLRSLELGASASIGQWNWITAAGTLVGRAAEGGHLRLGPHSVITSRHYVDCSGGVDVGPYTTLAGVRTTILTHQIDIAASRQGAAAVRIGAYCFVGSDVRITPGSQLPDRCVIAMGAVVAGELPDSGVLYGGVPARALKQVDSGEYFSRTVGHVD
jgi:acetyltransferase-like isoleucine patch superfamily enzyme